MPTTLASRLPRLATAVLALATALAAGCGSSPRPGGSQPPPGDVTPPPFLTGAGAPTGAAVTASVDPSGPVSMASADARLTLTAPAGAVGAPRTLSIQPITNEALGAVGGAFRLGPEGTTFEKPVTLVFRLPDDARAVDISKLGIAYQDASGFWYPVRGVRRDAAARTLTVETTHFSDWGVVWQAGVPGLYGNFTLTQTIGAVSFQASGLATLFYQGDSSSLSLYTVTGSVSPSGITPVVGACSPPSPLQQTLIPTVAEIWKSPASFRWSLQSEWDLACTDNVGAALPRLLVTNFDTLGIVSPSCSRGYVGTPPPPSSSAGSSGTYRIDCGANGYAEATWSFGPCVPGVACTDPALNPCVLQANSCDTGVPVCTATTTPVANGTACGAGGLDQCQSGACTCVPGVACAPQDACHTGAVQCDASGNPSCAQTALPDGTVCASTAVCSAGACKVLAAIAVTPATPSVLAGGTQQFVATGTYSDASTQDLTALVTWASSSTAAATIAAGGLATTLAAGTTTISATLAGVTGSATLTVRPTLQSIAVTPATPSVPAGLTQQFIATGTYSDNTTADLTSSVTWSSSTAAATIAAGGLATAVAVGSATITATSGAISGNATLTVTAAALTSLAVTPAGPSIPAGLTQQFVATGTYTNGTTADLTASVTWSSSTAAATIAAGGLATAVAVGSATITATSGAISGSATLTVTAAALTSLAVTPAGPSIPAGLTQQFVATGTYTNGTTADLTASVTWASSTGAATIAAGGLATAVAVGSTSISATSGAVTGATTLNVTAPLLTGVVVTPVNPTVTAGATPQFTATGTYTDRSTLDLTSTATWSSSDATVAIMEPTGVASTLAAGVTTITATSGGFSGTTTLTVQPPVLLSIAITPPNPSLIEGTTLQLTATGTYSNGTTADLTTQVTWSPASDPVATVSSTGVATGWAAGSTTVFATLGTVSGNTGITVLAPTLVSIAVTPPNPSVPAGLTQRFTATATYSNNTTGDVTSSVTWASDSAAATIDATGLATAVSVGSSNITATSGTITGTTTLFVTAAVLVSIEVTPPNPTVAVGAETLFTAIGTYSDATTGNPQVTWASDPTVATIDATGLATAVATGQTAVTATAGAVSGGTTLTVQ